MRRAARRAGTGSAADRPVASRTPRAPLPTRPQLLQLLLAPFGGSTGGSQAGRQDRQRAPAGRATGASRIVSPSAAAGPGPEGRALPADDLHPMPGPLA